MTEPNANSIVVAGNGTVYVGATTAAAPTAIDTTPLTGFTALGYCTPEGVKMTYGQTIVDINAWQSFYPVRKIVSEKTFQIAFSLREWTAHGVILAFGGGTITSSGSKYKYVPAAAGTIDSRSMIVDWQDGTKNYRLYIPTGVVTDNVESDLTRTDAANLPITFAATPSGTGDPFEFFTDDPAWADYSL